MKILIKHWPANMWVQTPVEIVRNLASENNIEPSEISEIIVDPPTQFRMHFYEEGFSSIMEAQFSTPYAIASVLLNPESGSGWYSMEKMVDPKLLALAKRVKPGKSEEHTLTDSFNMYIAGGYPEKTVTIKMRNGAVFERTQSIHKGHPDNMLSREELRGIFIQNASVAVGVSKAEKIADYVMSIEEKPDLSDFGVLFQ
jgi:2-methylcitrate dehydratase PrpD